jgi:hypothetical protein
MNHLINTSLFDEASLSHMGKEFNEAKPYKHLIIDNILLPEIAEEVFVSFPKEEVFNKKYKC